MANAKDLILRCLRDPQFEATHIAKRPLRGPQIDVINRVERHVALQMGGVLTIKQSRQTGKNEVSAILQRRHLLRRYNAAAYACWIRTAPTHKPQIVNSKKRLRELMRIGDRGVVKYPLFGGLKMHKEEGYIWRVGNAAVEFLSSGPQANVVGATASTCLDMDEAHKVEQSKFDEDFAPFTANTDAATIMWGVGGNGLDTLQFYIDKNNEMGRPDLNISIPCDVWMELHEPYRRHVEERVRVLGWDHPIIQTQYRLNSISALGRYMSNQQIESLLKSDHERHFVPRPECHYEMIVDIAAGNEEFNPDDLLQGFEDVQTDSSGIYIYEVDPRMKPGQVFPTIRIRNLQWLTGVALEKQQQIIDQLISTWHINKCTIDAVGVGKQIAESLVAKYGNADDGGIVLAYHGTNKTVSEDCYDLLARLNHDSVKMFIDDNSLEYAQLVKQLGWTQYAAEKGEMKLKKPKPDCHIDLVKALTYIYRNRPMAGAAEFYANEGDYE